MDKAIVSIVKSEQVQIYLSVNRLRRVSEFSEQSIRQ